MTKTVLLIIIALAAVAIVLFNYLHKRNVHYNAETLRREIAAEFEKKGAKEMGKEDLILALKRLHGCSHKMATLLLGRAHERGVVRIDHDKVTLS